jgi:hypothetical protein
MAQMVDRVRALISLPELSRELGLPQNAVRLLGQFGLFKPLEEPATALSGNGPHYGRADVMATMKWLEDADEVETAPVGWVSIRSILPQEERAPFVWASSFLAVLKGLVVACRIKGKSGDWKELSVEEESFRLGQSAALRSMASNLDDDTAVLVAVAADINGLTITAVGELITAGILPKSSTSPATIRMGDIRTFARQYATSGQIRTELGLGKRQGVTYLAAREISPVPYSPRSVIYRKDVENALGRPIPNVLVAPHPQPFGETA